MLLTKNVQFAIWCSMLIAVCLVGCENGGNDVVGPSSEVIPPPVVGTPSEIGEIEPPEPRKEGSELKLKNVQFPAGCQAVAMRLVLSQEGGSHFDFAPLSLENNRSLTRYRPFGAWVVDLADGYDFEAPVFVRIEIRAVEGACGVFKVGKAWEFNGVPTFDGVEDGEKKYSVSFPDFDEVQ